MIATTMYSAFSHTTLWKIPQYIVEKEAIDGDIERLPFVDRHQLVM